MTIWLPQNISWNKYSGIMSRSVNLDWFKLRFWPIYSINLISFNVKEIIKCILFLLMISLKTCFYLNYFMSINGIVLLMISKLIIAIDLQIFRGKQLINRFWDWSFWANVEDIPIYLSNIYIYIFLKNYIHSNNPKYQCLKIKIIFIWSTSCIYILIDLFLFIKQQKRVSYSDSNKNTSIFRIWKNLAKSVTLFTNFILKVNKTVD